MKKRTKPPKIIRHIQIPKNSINKDQPQDDPGVKISKDLKATTITLFRDKRKKDATNERKNIKFQQSKTIERTKRKS